MPFFCSEVMYNRLVKPNLDRIIALILLLFLLPVFLVISMILYFTGEGILFVQIRPGLDEVCFPLYKFKTMLTRYDDEGLLLPDEERITNIGRFLRMTSLDELPQLINVIRGEMSLIGPRPFLIEYLPLYNEDHKRRHMVRPGITGWAQVNGRNLLSWEDRLDHDIQYVENLSLRQDLYIIWKTFQTLVTARGIKYPEHVTMPKFQGYQKRKNT